ncbi:Multidrug resistance protein MdtA precursor [Aquisphaera giovannonii]|uniref:Multidrug resistance protein MdtA n=1 Tax=Aquisphaera giovannonii TaxID=406548 RepID=A0A5B9VZQ2_9BACT|nr:efflux RND transporter periplasmic adaptor subunit [Aquisphaera giovannonii]QEH33447.1 Multidrug resistance protein MdtA precursor [Aquisphaera giovannonii]
MSVETLYDRKSAAQPAKGVRRGTRPWRWALGSLALAAIAGGIYVASRGREGQAAPAAGQEHGRAGEPSGRVVKVATPRHGGLERSSDQPGTIRGFDFAPLYAKVSGYLKAMNVDRGDRVKAGQVLAEIYDPELDVAVLQAQAQLQHAEAQVRQSEAKLKTARAGVDAANAKLEQSHSMLEEAVAQRTYRKKALDRLTELARRNAVEQRLVDEAEDQYMASMASEHGAQSGITTAQAQVLEANADVDLAQADLVTAKAQVAVAEANVKKAKVFVEYEKVTAPFDGVITTRGDGVHVGAFIRAANEGGMTEPLLTVSRTDKMRTIVELPDTDAPHCNVGDPASVRIATLAGRVFKASISRISESEDLKTRTMRVEVDLDNKEGVLRDGMFGRVLIELEPPTKNLTIPSTCLLERGEGGKGAVFVVQDGKVKRKQVRAGMDNGRLVEILDGLSEKDEVVAEVTASLTEGLPVKPEPVKVAGGGPAE